MKFKLENLADFIDRIPFLILLRMFWFKKKVTWVLDHPGWVFNTMSSSRLKNWPGHQSSIWSAHRLLICCLFEWPTGHCTNACVTSLPLTIIQKSYITENRIFTLCRMITWIVFLRIFWNFISSLPGKRGGSLSFLTIFTFAVPELLDLIWRKIGFLPYIVVW